MGLLLSVAIPTFNRSEKIKNLYASFLSKLDCNLGDDVEIIICDNSDSEQAETNMKILAGSNICYKKNNKNLGFSGNIIRCLREAEGEFVWIISDDDEVNFDAFYRLIVWLKRTDLNSFNAVMLPFYNCSESGDKFLVNTQEEWGVGDGTLFDLIIRKNNIPFILFSGVILRNPRRDKEEILQGIEKDFEGNDYVQVPLFITIIGKAGKVVFYNEALQEYRSPAYIRFRLIRMVESMEKVLAFISGYLGNADKLFYRCHYKRWMGWLVLHRAGVREINGADEARWGLLWKWKFDHFSSLHDLVIAGFCILPKFLAQYIYRLRG